MRTRYTGVDNLFMRFIIILYFLSLSVASADTKLCNNSICGAFGAPQGSICEGWEFSIEPDMQIYDSDLTEEGALNSIDWLAKNFIKDGYLYDFGKENSLKRIKGYMLKKSYIDSNFENKEHNRKNYCTWLKAEGFWFD